MAATAGCSDFLDIEPYGYFSYEEVFASEELIDAFFATTYSTLPIEDFNYVNGYFATYPDTGTQTPSGWSAEVNGTLMTETISERPWDDVYTNIYYCNRLIEGLSSSPALTTDECNTLIGEARFLRAFSYYFLVRYYGGVPIVDEPTEYTDDSSSMKLSRSLESDVWDFIIEDLDYAITYLETKKVYGRANRYVALAFKSRVCLYAASIAKYGTLQEANCVGINSYRAKYFYEECMTAAKRLIDEGDYSLYEVYDDKSENFLMSFLDADASPEVIFARGYNYFATGRSHSHDEKVMPHQLDTGAGEQFFPFLNTVEAFEYANGNVADYIVPWSTTSYSTFTTVEAMFEGRDPRLAASIVLPNSELLGETIEIQDGVICDGEKMLGNNYGLFFDKVSETFVESPGANTIRGTGKSGGTLILTTGTGFFTRKYVDINLDASYRKSWKSQTDYIVIRLAEIYLNYVEAALETEQNLDQALIYLNLVKSRAGVATFSTLTSYDSTDAGETLMDRVQAERRSELFFEGFKFWDMIRRRTLLTEFSITGSLYTKHGLEIYYDFENNYYWAERDPYKSYSYDESRMYYQPIPSTELAKHSWPNNPGY